jgi:hypothetical protein
MGRVASAFSRRPITGGALAQAASGKAFPRLLGLGVVENDHRAEK